tara:strand:+ start:1100 stop:1444 length:345 start_codon:yes stop_codon:yes gene_type:complete
MTNLGRYFKLGFPGNIYLHALKRLPPLIKLMLTVDGEPNITLTRECRPYRIIRISIRPWLTTGTRARNIQYLDAILFDKITELVGGQLCRGSDRVAAITANFFWQVIFLLGITV